MSAPLSHEDRMLLAGWLAGLARACAAGDEAGVALRIAADRDVHVRMLTNAVRLAAPDEAAIEPFLRALGLSDKAAH